MPDVSPRRNVKHAQESQRAFVKEAATCPVEAWEMVSPPTWAQTLSHKAKWQYVMEMVIKAEGDAHIPAATQSSWGWHNLPSWKRKQTFPASLQIPTDVASACQMQRKACLHINSPNSWRAPYLPDIIKCSTHLGYPQLPSLQKHQCRADHEDTFQPCSSIYSGFYCLVFLIKKTMCFPTWLPRTIILLTLHILCKRNEAWLQVWHGHSPKQNCLNNSDAFDSLRVLVKHSVLTSEYQSGEWNLKWPQLMQCLRTCP